ncbi:hypothetical protein B4158_5144 [Bacillus cereus]|nr:hypothetical protein B4158_5144 [Bacillus cereus]QDD86513.1 hypothetical protein FORC087_5224 [Bacillus cereus]
MIIVRRMDKRCGIFVKVLTNLWRNGLTTKKEDAQNEHPLSIY